MKKLERLAKLNAILKKQNLPGCIYPIDGLEIDAPIRPTMPETQKEEKGKL